MKETIKIKNSKFYLMFFVYCAIVTACILTGISMYKSLFMESPPSQDMDAGLFLLAGSTIIFIEFTVILIQWISRRILNNRLFDITEDGIEQVYSLVSFMIFFLMPTAKLLPWECVKELKIATWTGGRKYVVAEIRKDKLPKSISPLFRMAINAHQAGAMKGLYFGSRNANISADELLKILMKYYEKYQDK